MMHGFSGYGLSGMNGVSTLSALGPFFHLSLVVGIILFLIYAWKFLPKGKMMEIAVVLILLGFLGTLFGKGGFGGRMMMFKGSGLGDDQFCPTMDLMREKGIDEETMEDIMEEMMEQRMGQ